VSRSHYQCLAAINHERSTVTAQVAQVTALSLTAIAAKAER
jgi:hypothetical protein